MAGGQILFNNANITGWYENCQFSMSHPEDWNPDFYIERRYIEEHMKHYVKSNKTEEHPEYGTKRYYHVVVGKKRLEDGAWYFEGEKAGKYEGWIGYRVSRRGDPGNPHDDVFEQPEGDGVTVEEDWFG